MGHSHVIVMSYGRHDCHYDSSGVVVWRHDCPYIHMCGQSCRPTWLWRHHCPHDYDSQDIWGSDPHMSTWLWLTGHMGVRPHMTDRTYGGPTPICPHDYDSCQPCCPTWLWRHDCPYIQMCGKTHPRVRHDWFICVTWLMHITPVIHEDSL